MISDPFVAEVSSLGDGGDGRIETPFGAFFVPFTAPGDKLRLLLRRDGTSIAEAVRLSDGPDRIVPVCSHFERCGACAMQHISPSLYATWKHGRIKRALSAAGLSAPVADPFVVASGSRRRVRLAVDNRGRPRIGYRAGQSRRVVAVEECPIAEAAITDVLPLLSQYLPADLRAEVTITQIAGAIDVAVETAAPIDLPTSAALAGFADECDIARITWAGEPVVTRRSVSASVGAVSVELPPGAFIQPTEAGEAMLRSLSGAALAGVARIADLFAGCGLLGLALASDARIGLYEEQAAQVAAIRRAAPQVHAEARDLRRRPLSPQELTHYDGVLLDPPRAGAREQVRRLGESGIAKIAYASCNPATFVRDARTLVNAGFTLGEIQPIDQFLYSPHVELFAVFER